MGIGKHGGSRQGAGRKRKWASEAERKQTERLEKRTNANRVEGDRRKRPPKSESHAINQQLFREGLGVIGDAKIPLSEPGVTSIPMQPVLDKNTGETYDIKEPVEPRLHPMAQRFSWTRVRTGSITPNLRRRTRRFAPIFEDALPVAINVKLIKEG